jgi:hypothetical protein
LEKSDQLITLPGLDLAENCNYYRKEAQKHKTREKQLHELRKLGACGFVSNDVEKKLSSEQLSQIDNHFQQVRNSFALKKNQNLKIVKQIFDNTNLDQVSQQLVFYVSIIKMWW